MIKWRYNARINLQNKKVHTPNFVTARPLIQVQQQGEGI